MGGAGNWLGRWLSHFLPLIAALGEELLSRYFWCLEYLAEEFFAYLTLLFNSERVKAAQD